MDYYRREKFRKDLFENKLRDDDPNVRPLLDSITQSMGIKIGTRGPKGREPTFRGAKALGERLKKSEGSSEIGGSHSFLGGKMSLTSDFRIKTERFNEGNEDFIEENGKPVEKREKSGQRRENSAVNMEKSLERIEKSSLRIDSFQEPPAQNLEKAPKIVISSNSKLFEMPNKHRKGLKSQFSQQNAPEKPFEVCKKHRRLVFLKNRILEIEDDRANSNTLTSERDESSKQEDSLFLKILRNGVSPTKFFLQHTKT